MICMSGRSASQARLIAIVRPPTYGHGWLRGEWTAPGHDESVSELHVPGHQWAATSGDPGRGQVEQREPVRVGRLAQVGPDQLGLDPVLAGCEPVHRRVYLVGGGVGHGEVVGQGRVGPPTGRGQLRAWPAY